MASRKEYNMLFQLNAQLGSNYSSTFNTAQGAITSMQNEITALTRTQSNISSYTRQQQAVENTQKRLEVLQQQYRNIKREMQETGNFSSALENKLLTKQQQIDRASTSLENQTNKLNQMAVSLREAGIDTGNLSGETARLGNEVDEIKTKQLEAANEASNFGTAASSAFMAAGQALVAAGITVALKEAVGYFKEFTQASMEYEMVTAAMRRTVGGTTAEIGALGGQFKDLATVVPISLGELGKIAESAGQLGVAREYVYEFTQVMAMLGTTTDLSADSAATMLAQFSNITGLSDYGRLGAVVANLGDATATTATKVVEMSQGMAASASIAGFAETDIMALAAATGSLGIESQAGSTALSTLISTLYKAIETGDKLDEFSSIANMSASEFSVAWGDDPIRAMDAFIQGLNDTERNGRSAIVILDELGISNIRQTRAILGLANAGDLLSNTITQASQAWEENTALQEKAGIMYDTTQSQLAMRENAYYNMRVAIGDNYTPALQELYSVETELINKMTELIEQNPELVKAVTAFTGVVGLAVGGLTAYVAVSKIATIASAALTAAIPGVNIIMGAVIGVAALTAGLVALTTASKRGKDESRELTAFSREQYLRLSELNKEYESAVEVYGEASYEAQSLGWQIDRLTKEYETGKQRFVEYVEEHERLVTSYSEMVDAHSESGREINKERRSTIALIQKLEELTVTTDSAAQNKQAILGIIQALNEQVPELALNYDDVVSSTAGFIDSIYDIAEAQAAQAQLEAQWNEYIARVGEHSSLKSAKESAEQNAKIAKEEYEAALDAYNEMANLFKHDPTGISLWFGTRNESKALGEAYEQLEFYNQALEETSELYQVNADEIAKLEEAFGSLQQAQIEMAESGANIREVITSIKLELDELAVAYEEAYAAAMDSVSGQYKLWDEAADVWELSAGEINYAMETQARYWKEYNTNLESLSERSRDIEGLSELLASFADGSEDSVNVIAGLAMATEGELRDMVDTWQVLQAEQQTVAESLAQLETDFAASMATLQSELESTIEEMNLSEEAAESGRTTIEGFVRGTESMLPSVSAAYAKIAEAALDAIDAQFRMKIPSDVMQESDGGTASRFTAEVIPMAPEVQEALRDAMNVAETSSKQGQMGISTQLMQSIQASQGVNEAVPTETQNNQERPKVELNFSPSFEITGGGNKEELQNNLDIAVLNMRDMIIDIIEQREFDIARGAYT